MSDLYKINSKYGGLKFKMHIATYIIDIVALLYLIGLLHTDIMMNSYRKKPFLYGIILTITIILSEAGTILASNDYFSFRTLNIFCNILGFSFTPMIPIALIYIFDINTLKRHKLLLLPTLVNIVSVVLSPLLKIVFYVDINNEYIRGDYFFIFVTVYIINLLLLVIGTINIGKKYHYPIMRKMIALSLFTVAGTSIQLVDSSVYSSWHCVTLSLFLYFQLMSEFDSSFDTLTGLYNRAAFDKVAEQMTSHRGFSVIVMDINDFKNINDTYGHDYGDTAIKEVALIIRESFDKHYTCYRLGGDEFSIICNNIDEENIQYQFRCMTNALAEKRRNDHRLPTVSYGYSIFQGGEKPNFQKNLKEADDQMYHYKKLHKVNAAVDHEI